MMPEKTIDNDFHLPAIRQEAQSLLHLALPIIAGQLVQMSMGTIDVIMCGMIGTSHQAAASLGGAVWILIWILGYGPMAAVSACVSQSYGAGDLRGVSQIVRQALLLAILLAAFSATVLLAAGVPFLASMSLGDGSAEDREVIPMAIGYVKGIAFGLPAVLMTMALRGFTEGIGLTRPVFLMSIVGVVSNLFFNSLLMFGWFGLPKLGAIGTGYASAISYWMMFLFLLSWVMLRPQYKRFGLFQNWNSAIWPGWKSLLGIGLPISVALSLEVSLFTFAQMLMTPFGKEVIAAYQIALNVASNTYMIPLGLSMAITVRVGHGMGAGRPAAARRSGLVGIAMAAAFMAVAALAIGAFAGPIASLYNRDSNVIATAIPFLYAAALFQLSDGLQASGSSSLRGLKDTTWPMIITALAYWGVGVPVLYVMGVRLGFGPIGMWMGLIAGLTTAAVLLNFRFLILTRHLVDTHAKRVGGETDAPGNSLVIQPKIDHLDSGAASALLRRPPGQDVEESSLAN